MNRSALWNEIESRLESSLAGWRARVDALDQIAAVKARSAGRNWSDDKVFEALSLAVLSSNTDWSRIERIRAELAELFDGFSLASYAEVSESEIAHRFLPWFKERKAGSMSLERDLVNLVGAAQILLDYSRLHGTADDYFTSLLHLCEGDPKRAALRLGCQGEYKLPSLGVPLAAEALKNLGFDVAKPDRHLMRALGSFGLVRFRGWPRTSDGPQGRKSPVSTSKSKLLAVMAAAEKVAEVAEVPVVLVDNAIWLLCAKSGLYLSNSELAAMAPEGESIDDQAESLGALIRSWMDEDDSGEQRETIEYLVRALDEDRLSGRELFPEELKGKTW